jgi:hypothetical protein
VTGASVSPASERRTGHNYGLICCGHNELLARSRQTIDASSRCLIRSASSILSAGEALKASADRLHHSLQLLGSVPPVLNLHYLRASNGGTKGEP